ncbi:MAG TPA: flavodoxin family protein, partial [Chromatiales bacterium]|nr:flavodoxin family protein [Chromatiales bacterium]
MTQKKRVMGIVGSYRKGGMIDTAVSEILRAAERDGALVSKVYLLDAHIEYCKNCRKCMQSPGE